MKAKRRWGSAGVWLLAAGLASADISFQRVTWGNGGDPLGWYSRDAVGTVSSPGTGGNPDGFLQFAFVGAQFPGLQSDALVTSAAGYVGDYTIGTGLSFNFLGSPSSAQALYFQSAAGGGTIWTYTLSPASSGWENYSVSFLSDAGWTRLSGSASFASALTQVSLIGITVTHLNDGSPVTYGLDNWEYLGSVPEPAAVWMVVAALGAGALLLRRQVWPKPKA